MGKVNGAMTYIERNLWNN